MELVEQYGFRQGIYRGFWPMFWRDVPAWATYFWGYDFFKSLFTRKDEPLTLWLTVRLILCAGVAGQLSWVVSYPFDVVKCVIQCSATSNLFANTYNRTCVSECDPDTFTYADILTRKC